MNVLAEERQKPWRVQWLLRGWGIPVVAFLLMMAVITDVTHAATVSRKVLVSFNGTLAGDNYILGPGETDVTGTFQKNGSATFSAGIADMPGNVDSSSGFFFDSSLLGVSLTNTNWVTEAVLIPDVSASEQPDSFNHFLDVQGDLFFRYNGNTVAPKFTQFGYWDGANEPAITTPNLPTSKYSHVALTWSSGTRTLEAFIDGVSQGTVSTGNVFATPSTNVGYGFFSRTGFLNRAINGKLASVAFSTFSGTFNPGFGPGFDFQLDPTDTAALALSLEVNTMSGAASIVNDTLAPITIQGYDIVSAAGSLDVSPTGWWSLSEQNLNPVSGGDDLGETWQEGANPSQETFLEAFLLGSTTIPAGESLSLGKAYDASVDVRDLQFRYRLAGVSGTVTGVVDYDDSTPQIFGDFDDDLDVDGQDLLVWQRNVGTSHTLPNDRTPGSVTHADLMDWEVNYGTAVGSNLLQADVGTVPEVSSGVMMLIALVYGSGLQYKQRQSICQMVHRREK